jgi:hypothetical protein
VEYRCKMGVYVIIRDIGWSRLRIPRRNARLSSRAGLEWSTRVADWTGGGCEEVDIEKETRSCGEGGRDLLELRARWDKRDGEVQLGQVHAPGSRQSRRERGRLDTQCVCELGVGGVNESVL